MCKKILCLTLSLILILGMTVTVYAQPENIVRISTVEEFLTFAQNCRLDTYSQGLIVALDADLDLTGVEFSPIALFSGTFMGAGHTISGVEITVNGSEQGFFRKLSQSAYVSDLHIQGTVAPGGSRSQIGGLVGCNAGTVTDCSFTGTVSGRDQVGGIAGVNTVTGIIQRCFAEGDVSGNHFVGGIAGSNDGVVRLCENKAAVNIDARQNSVDLSEITLDTFTNTENAVTVTDIGGIAGASSGVIRECINRDNVGYPYMGYNIGGIVGSLTGYLTGCENYGTVSGRKEVGGIVGQMEPAVLLQYDTDTFQILEGQLATLASLTDRASVNAQTNTNLIKSYITSLQTYTQNAEDALDSIREVTDLESLLAIVQTVGSSITGIDSSIRGLAQAVQNTGAQVEKDLQDITAQAKNIQNTLSGGEENLGGTVADVSDQDTPEDLTGKVSASHNYGAVSGDWNIGGIAGAMAVENDLDPEQDIVVSGSMTFNAAGKLRSVIVDCENQGNISARKKNAGGIVGWQSMGLVRECISSSEIDAPTADHIGGITGQSLGYIRNCRAKSVITGTSFVGGIAGSGTVVTDCRAMSWLTGDERVGGILGFMEDAQEQSVTGNLYAYEGNDPGGIDGIRYEAVANAQDRESFFAAEDIPENFQNVTVTFLFADGTEKTVTVPAGSVLTDGDIPQIPSDDGQLGHWEGLEEVKADPLYRDVSFQAVYSGHGRTVATEEKRDGKPLLLLQGDFSSGSVLTLTPATGVTAPEDGYVLLDAVAFAVTESNAVTTARYLLPGSETDRLQVYVRDTEDHWKPVSHLLDGSYIVFPVTAQDQGFAIWVTPRNWTPWIIGGGIGILLLAGLAVLLIRRRKRSPKA